MTPFVGIGIPSGGEWIIVLVIIVIFFGIGKLPQVLGQMGKGVKAFKDGMNTNEDDAAPAEIATDAIHTIRETVTEAEEVTKA